jgi:hypothetical protein
MEKMATTPWLWGSLLTVGVAVVSQTRGTGSLVAQVVEGPATPEREARAKLDKETTEDPGPTSMREIDQVAVVVPVVPVLPERFRGPVELVSSVQLRVCQFSTLAEAEGLPIGRVDPMNLEREDKVVAVERVIRDRGSQVPRIPVEVVAEGVLVLSQDSPGAVVVPELLCLPRY